MGKAPGIFSGAEKKRVLREVIKMPRLSVTSTKGVKNLQTEKRERDRV